MNIGLFIICYLSVLTRPVFALDSNTVSAVAQYAGQLSDGQVYLELTQPVKMQDCHSKRIMLTSAHAETQKQVISKVMRAQMFNRKIILKLKGCQKGVPTINEINDLEIQ